MTVCFCISRNATYSSVENGCNNVLFFSRCPRSRSRKTQSTSTHLSMKMSTRRWTGKPTWTLPECSSIKVSFRKRYCCLKKLWCFSEKARRNATRTWRPSSTALTLSEVRTEKLALLRYWLQLVDFYDGYFQVDKIQNFGKV